MSERNVPAVLTAGLYKASCFVLLASSLFYFFSYPEADPDLWGHLFFGGGIVQNSELPLRNLYSFTAPDHPWINHDMAAALSLVVFALLLAEREGGYRPVRSAAVLLLAWYQKLCFGSLFANADAYQAEIFKARKPRGEPKVPLCLLFSYFALSGPTQNDLSGSHWAAKIKKIR